MRQRPESDIIRERGGDAAPTLDDFRAALAGADAAPLPEEPPAELVPEFAMGREPTSKADHDALRAYTSQLLFTERAEREYGNQVVKLHEAQTELVRRGLIVVVKGETRALEVDRG